MATKFFFFTDPTLLNTQAIDRSFGPAGTTSTDDQFRITDLHTASAAAPSFAICDGLICAQKDGQGTLTLVLKPTQQPPFDFPFISYVLYKGIDPSSLLVSGNAEAGGTIDVSKAADNKLVDSLQKSWAANLNTGSPTRECLGLHLTPASVAASYPDLVLSNYADGEPLDRLFYQGDGKFQLPLVRGGWRIGDFITASFGLEIFVERIGYRPKIGLARKRENLLAVTSLDANTTYATNDATYFMHWHAKEECLNFIDPCALWGSFFATALRSWNGANSQFDKLSGNAIYETVLRGAATGAANFANRNRTYFDIRDEHGNSLNYYQADGPNLQLTLDPNADIDSCQINYYASGWPSFAVDNTQLPAGTTGTKVDVRFALPKTQNTRPLIYISVGFRGRFQRLKDRKRFLDRQRRADAQYLYETSMTIPLADDAGVKRVLAGYQRIHLFKRLATSGGLPVAATPGTLAPARSSMLDHLLPLLTDSDLPVTGATILRTYDDVFYVEAGVVGGDGFAANPAIAFDSVNAVLMLVPKAHNTPSFSLRPVGPKISWPALSLPSGNASIFQYLKQLLPAPLKMVIVADPQQSNGKVELLYSDNPQGIAQSISQSNPSAIVLCLSRSEISDLRAMLAANAPVYGPAMLSLAPGTSYRDNDTTYLAFGLSVNMLSGAQTVARVTQSPQTQIYRHADL
jgi:hypothetical protein